MASIRRTVITLGKSVVRSQEVPMRETWHGYDIRIIFHIVLLSSVLSASIAVPQLSAQVTGIGCDSVGSNAFEGCYYDDLNLTNLKIVRTDRTINFDWRTTSPDPSIAADHF